MTLCRSNSFDSLFRNSECSKGLRLIPFWQQCQQKQPREFQCRDMHTICFSSTKYWNTWGLTFAPEQRLNRGQGVPLGSEILHQHLLCKCSSSLTCVSPYGCTGLGRWNRIARDSLTITSYPPHLPLFLSGNTFPPGWALKDLSSQFKSLQTVCMLFPAPTQCNDIILFFHGMLLSPKKEHMLCS